MTLACPVWAESVVKINIQWKYKDFADQVQLYEAKGQPPLWQTKSVSNLAAVPVSAKITEASFQVVPGQRKRFVLVVENPSDQPVYFFAAPHTVHPEEDTLGFKFKCLCINHAFTIGPKQIWYRVVELRLSDEYIGKELTISHTIIGVDKKRAASFSNETTMPDM